MKGQTALHPVAYEQKLIGIVHRLPHKRVLQLLDFAQFLELQIAGDKNKRRDKEEFEDEIASPRVLGLHKGQGWISDDFNEPLSDAFWLGEE